MSSEKGLEINECRGGSPEICLEKSAGARSWRLGKELGSILCAVGNLGRMVSRGMIMCSFTVKSLFCRTQREECMGPVRQDGGGGRQEWAEVSIEDFECSEEEF